MTEEMQNLTVVFTQRYCANWCIVSCDSELLVSVLYFLISSVEDLTALNYYHKSNICNFL